MTDYSWAQLVEGVKKICRIDPNGKAFWCSWCDSTANGTKDPSRMDSNMLQGFFDAYEAGNIIPKPVMLGPDGKPLPPKPALEAPELAEVVRNGQKVSPAWKQAWSLYCEKFGEGTYDPMRHNKEFITNFFEFTGAAAFQALSQADAFHKFDENQQIVKKARIEAQLLGRGDDERATRDPRNGASPLLSPHSAGVASVATQLGMPMVLASYDGRTQAQGLAQKVKNLQRTDPTKKALWSEFCHQHAGGVLDPARHEESTLALFFQLLEKRGEYA